MFDGTRASYLLPFFFAAFFVAFFFMGSVVTSSHRCGQYPIASRRRCSACSRPRRS